MHLLIPFACSSAPACVQALDTLQLPGLEKLLRRLALVQTDVAEATSLTPPHERALAQCHGMSAPDGSIAWAARESALSGRDPGKQGWAWITPVHWDVGADHITMADPRALDLQQAESQSLLSAMQPYFAEDGVLLEYATPQRWLAHGEVFDDLASASLDRVAGREISAWMPRVPRLRRLQNEMQMLLYTHPVNDARIERGLATVNSFWVSGTGRLPKNAISVRRENATPIRPEPTVLSTVERVEGPGSNLCRPSEVAVVDSLRDAALRDDWTAWAQAWFELDQNECLKLLQSLDAGKNIQLTLCGERSALRFGPAQDGMLNKLRRSFTKTTLKSLQDQL